MNEFIYSVKDIFGKVLEESNISKYYIPPYQRGYKWASDNRYSPVPQMLIDVYYAYKKETLEYYLQYITVKKNKEFGYEVIDGQQRLTTLSLIFYRYSNKFIRDNIAKDKVVYARYRTNVFDYINDNIEHMDINRIDSQDKYYMCKAAKTIDEFLDLLGKNDDLDGYFNYLYDNVKIILNEESEFVSSEETFANLNDNKVPLTNSYLIKGLLLTLSARYVNGNGSRISYKEVIDQRQIMGRTWDEIMSWIEQPRVSHYFFGIEDKGMEKILALIELPKQQKEKEISIIDDFSEYFKGECQKQKNDLELFNKFNERVGNEQEALDVLSKLKHIYRKFKSIYDNYEDCSLYNEIGYILFCKEDEKDRSSVLRAIISKNKEELELYLKESLKARIPELTQNNIGDFKYKSKNHKLTNLLLSFSVFPQGENPRSRFDFYQYDNNNWSFEHIYPQNPPKNGIVKIAKVATVLVKQAITNYYRTKFRENKGKPDIVKNLCIEYRECIRQYKDDNTIDCNKIPFLYSESLDDEDFCGNMALLSGGANSALSNNPYIAKRLILQEKEGDGYFIPSHTKIIFNKMISSNNGKSLNPDLTIWDQADVEAHAEWMIERNKEIRDKFTK